jgi:hypothetical protein
MSRMSEKKKSTITLNMCDSGRMAALEKALEYVINKADGRNFVLEGVPILDDPKITEARLLLPGVKWSWVQKR